MAQLLIGRERLSPAGVPIEAVLFDKDGTMSHSEPMLLALAEARVRACVDLAETAGCAPDVCLELGDLLRRAYGLLSGGLHPAGTTAVAPRDHNLLCTATALAQVGLGWPEALAMAEEAFRRTDALHGQAGVHGPRPTEGLGSVLERLTAAGVRCAVISNDHEEGIHAFLRQNALAHHVAAVRSADHRPRKPDPGAVLALCGELEVPPGRCALIGDANSDLHMARAAGVAVAIGYRSGWHHPVPLDPTFPHLHRWSDLAVVA